MKRTKLLEFINGHNEVLRGILTDTENKCVHAVVMMGGFERSATTEAKFKILADKLAEHDIFSLRFDYAGIGLADGDFSRISVKKLAADLEYAIAALTEETACEKISFVAHSLPSCIMADRSKRDIFYKIVLLSPAFNQKELLRYWFTSSSMKKKNPDIKIDWDNFREYLNEESFRKYCHDTRKMTKAHYAGTGYFIESSEVDYSEKIMGGENILHVHGAKDEAAPLAGVSVNFSHKIIVENGDHDLERPDMIKQWLDKTVEFLIT
jgi:esterase/lipase